MSWTAGLKTLFYLQLFGSQDSLIQNPFSPVSCHPVTRQLLIMQIRKSYIYYYICPAVLQSIARKNHWPLDKMTLTVDVTKKTKDDFGHPPREGAYIHGLFMEGQN